MAKSQSLLIIGKVWPEPQSSAAGSRMMQLIELFLREDFEICFASAASESDFSVKFSETGVKTAAIKINDSGFDEFISNLKPDMVLFDRFMTEEQFGWRVAEQCPEALRILDTEDLHCYRQGRYHALTEGRNFELNDLSNEVAKREIASILRCDLSLIISEVEMRLLTNHFRIQPELLHYIPFLVDLSGLSFSSDFSERRQFVSIGNFLHEPNRDSVYYLKDAVWPLIRERLPEAELHIYGAYPSQQISQMHSEQDGFLIKGRAVSAQKVIGESRVLLAPLRFGAGLKGKLLDAMLSGTPSVTTFVGAEGMHLDFDWPGAIEEEPLALAAAAAELYQDEEKWRKAQQKIYSLLSRKFSRSKFEVPFSDRLKLLKKELKEHRRRNFLGSVLRHHTLNSTKYMSKWIEEKNK